MVSGVRTNERDYWAKNGRRRRSRETLTGYNKATYARECLNEETSGKIDHAKFPQESARSTDPIANRCIRKRKPEGCENKTGGDSHSFHV